MKSLPVYKKEAVREWWAGQVVRSVLDYSEYANGKKSQTTY